MSGTLNTNGQAKKDSVLPKVDSLKPVIVRPSELRARFRGDTLEYNTGNIRMRSNANVEELLGRLPGLHLDPDGTITYNGEVIKQLLIDGENFFGTSPTMVTRNFDASKIDRIQLLDRKPDDARFTGIDDGTRIKTLNLVLKEDSKRGYFGKLGAGSNGNDIYNGGGLFASFRDREQIAALGAASNTGNTNFGGDPGQTPAGIFATFGNDDPLGASAGRGIPRLFASALHYANTWNGNANHLLGNYQYSNLLTKPVTITNLIQTLPDSSYKQYKRAMSVNRQDQHTGEASIDWSTGRLSAFRLNINFNHTVGNNQYGDTGYSAFNEVAVNRTQRSIQSVNKRDNFSSSLGWRIESAKKAGRIFSISAQLAHANISTEGYLYSISRYYQPDGDLQEGDTTDQRKQINNGTYNLGGSLNFAEPLRGGNILGFNFGVTYKDNQSLQNTYDRGDGKYQVPVDSLSNSYNDHSVNPNGTLTLQGSFRGIRYNLATGVSWFSYRQNDIFKDTTFKFRYFNFLPRLQIDYSPNNFTRVILNYSGSSQQPDFSLLQPITNNNDPLHITLGNPNLRPGFIQNWSIVFSRIKKWVFNLAITYGLNSNSISTKTSTDSLGRQISQPVNSGGNRKFSLNSSINKRIGSLDAGLNSSLNYTRDNNYVDADLSHNNNYRWIGGITLGKYVPDKYSIQLDSRFTYVYNQSSINTSASIHYWLQNLSSNMALYVIRGFEIRTNVQYVWQQRTSTSGEDRNLTLWNASVLRNFMENRIVLSLQANNLLNQNSGISSSNLSNSHTETSTNIPGRYWLLSLTWRFDRKYKAK